ncbi:MAG: tyrosine-protein phosphatase [Dehalococcoidia bacterium]|nr:tyrosine-protein phosphatase [Dehalococcoidia bacterium]
MTAEIPGRFLPIAESHNFRHMGGYPAAGRVTRSDMLFRGGVFALASDAETAAFRALDLHLIVDLRTPEERARRPLELSGDRPRVLAGAGISPGNMAPYIRSVLEANGETADFRPQMALMYRQMLEEALPVFRGMFAGILEEPGSVMLVCSTGKDRAGVASALLLSALGVGKEVVFEDYMLSALAYRGREVEVASQHGFGGRVANLEVFRDVFTVHADYLEAFWQSAEAMSGTMQAFLCEALGLTDAALAALRERYTSPPSS